MKLEILSVMNAERAARRPAILVTDIENAQQRVVRESDFASDPLRDLLAERLQSGKSGLVERDGRNLFLTVRVPPVRLILIGAVHISQALVPMAESLDLDVTVIDPRTAFATSERFPDSRLLAEWPDTVLDGLDRFTALAALTHDPKIDDPALIAALRSECFYVGALGSVKTHARRIERLRRAGVPDEAIARIRAPIGLFIGAVSPAEIAVSILAQLVAVLRRPEMAA